MGEIFYRIVTFLYVVAIFIARFFDDKAAKMWQGRKHQWKTIGDKLTGISGPILWFHCSSLGEFEQGRPVIEKYKKAYPSVNIVLTFFSPSGYEVRKNYELADAIFYLPFDRRINARKFLNIVKPTAAFFIKYEYWHFYLDELHKRKIPTFSISSIFRKNQLFFKPQGEFYRNILHHFDYFFVQNELSKKLLNSIDIHDVTIAGDTRFDRVAQICSQAKDIELAEIFKDEKPMLVIGSSWPNDIEKLSPFLNKWKDKLKLIIAPHEIAEKNLLHIENLLRAKTIRFSKGETDSIKNYDALIIDNVGMLSSLYRYGEYAYIGGAFDHGIHNTLEAATFGKPLFFGKGERNVKYQEVMDLIELGAGFEIENWEEMDEKFSALFNDSSAYEKAANASQNYIQKNTGATELIFEKTQQSMVIS